MRIVTIVLLALSTVALAGCPDKDAKPDPAASAKAPTSAAPAATSAAAPAKSAGSGW
ncbi:MAG: hypothetical protein JST00_10910 [Deltaproteobacteria bacterium]|nr:hypothetical protein [Deltaproteobacteria bacterium]